MGSTTTIQGRDDRELSPEWVETLKAQAQSQRGEGPFAGIGPLIDLEREFRPQWSELDLQTLEGTLSGVGGQRGLTDIYREDIAPTISGIDADALAARTAAEQDIIDQYGPSLAGKLRDAAGNRELIESILAEAEAEGGSPLGAAIEEDAMAMAPTELQGQLGQRAGELMDRGASSAQARRYQQQLAASMAARGMGQTTAGGIGESIRMAEMDEAERRANTQLAAGLQGQIYNQRQGDRQYRMGAAGLGEQLRAGRYGRRMGAAGLAQQTGGDPFLSLLGRPSGVSGQVGGWGGQGMAFGQNIGTPSIFQPESQYMSDLQNSNSQVAMATNAARANMSSGLFGGLGTAIGGIFNQG